MLMLLNPFRFLPVVDQQYTWAVTGGSNVSLSNDNQRFTWFGTGSGTAAFVRTSVPITQPTYAEFLYTALPGGPSSVGITRESPFTIFYNTGNSAMFSGGGCGLVDGGFYNDETVTANTAYKFQAGDIIGVAFNPTTRQLWFSKNGTWLSGNPSAGTGETMIVPAGHTWYFYASQYTCNITGTYSVDIFPELYSFTYPIPSDFFPYQPSAYIPKNLGVPIYQNIALHFSPSIVANGTLSVQFIGSDSIIHAPQISESVYIQPTNLTQTSTFVDRTYDPHFDLTRTILFGDGANDSTTITDSSPAQKTWLTTGNARIRTANSVFGGSSIYLDGSGDIVYADSSPDWNLTSPTWTVEGWFYEETSSAGTIMSRRTAGFAGWVLTTGSLRGVVDGAGFEDRMSWPRPTMEQWHHFAFVRSGSTLWMFIDGQQVATRSVSTFSDQAVPLRIGVANETTENFFRGFIDDFRWTNGVARYTSNFSVPDRQHSVLRQFPTAMMTDDKMLTQHTTVLVDTDEYAENVSTLLLANGVNNSTTIVDSSITPKTYTVVGNARISTDQFKSGLSSLFLTGGCIRTASGTDFTFGTGDFTVESWVYSTGGTNTERLIASVWGGAGLRWTFGINSLGRFTFYRNAQYDWSTPSSIPINQWVHLAASRNNGTIRLFVNGVAQFTSASASDNLTQVTTQFTVGGQDGSTGDFNGYIDDLRVTKGIGRYTSNFDPQLVLSSRFYSPTLIQYAPPPILDLPMNEPDGTTIPIDNSPYAQTLTRFGTPVISTDAQAPAGVSCLFDGSADYYSLSNSQFLDMGTQSWTIEAHVTWAGGWSGIIGWTGTGGSEAGFYVVNDGRIAVKVSENASYNGGSVPSNTRTHVAATYDVLSNLVRIFINGVLISGLTSGVERLVIPTSAVTVGRMMLASGVRDFNGRISGLRVHKGACLYTASFTPPA
jgi:hypothetical protein